MPFVMDIETVKLIFIFATVLYTLNFFMKRNTEVEFREQIPKNYLKNRNTVESGKEQQCDGIQAESQKLLNADQMPLEFEILKQELKNLPPSNYTKKNYKEGEKYQQNNSAKEEKYEVKSEKDCRKNENIFQESFIKAITHRVPEEEIPFINQNDYRMDSESDGEEDKYQGFILESNKNILLKNNRIIKQEGLSKQQEKKKKRKIISKIKSKRRLKQAKSNLKKSKKDTQEQPNNTMDIEEKVEQKDDSFTAKLFEVVSSSGRGIGKVTKKTTEYIYELK